MLVSKKYVHTARNIHKSNIHVTINTRKKIRGNKIYVSNSYPLIPSLCGCIAAYTFVYPFDTYKIRMQHGKHNPFHKNIFAGYVFGAFLCSAYACIYFVTYGKLSEVMCLNSASSIATFFTLFVKVPSKVVVKVLQNGDYMNIIKIARTIFNKNGLFGFFRGFWFYALNDIPENIVKYNMYDILFLAFPQEPVMIGVLTGLVTSMIIQPLDVLQNITMCNIEGKKIDFMKINYFSGIFVSIITTSIKSVIFYNVMKLMIELT